MSDFVATLAKNVLHEGRTLKLTSNTDLKYYVALGKCAAEVLKGRTQIMNRKEVEEQLKDLT